MKLQRRDFLRLAAGAAALPTMPHIAKAQAGYPNRIVRMVVGFPAGGGADAVSRIISARLSELLGQQVVVENKPGAGSNLALDHVANSPAGWLHDHHVGSRAGPEPRPVHQAELRPRRLRAGVADRHLHAHAGRAEGPSRKDDGGLHRARESQSRQGDLRVARHRHAIASDRRIPEDARQLRHDPRGLSRRGRRRDERPDGEPHRRDGQHHRLAAAACAQRQRARPRGDVGQALDARAGIPDHAGIRRTRFRHLVVVRPVHAAEDAAGHHPEGSTPTWSRC